MEVWLLELTLRIIAQALKGQHLNLMDWQRTYQTVLAIYYIDQKISLLTSNRCPWLTAVGATQLSPSDQPLSPTLESAAYVADFNFTSSGGFSNYNPLPGEF